MPRGLDEISRWARERAATLAEGRDLPLDVVAVADDLGLAIVESEDDGEPEGQLRRRENRWEVVLRPARGAGRARWRFTLAHEIAHYMIEQEWRFRPHSGSDYWALERVCDQAASELLLPDSLVSRCEDSLPAAHVLFDQADRLAKLGEVSYQAACRRLASRRDVAFAGLEFDGDVCKLRWRTDGDVDWIPERAGKHLPESHALARIGRALIETGRDVDAALPALAARRRRNWVHIAALVGAEEPSATQPPLPGFD